VATSAVVDDMSCWLQDGPLRLGAIIGSRITLPSLLAFLLVTEPCGVATRCCYVSGNAALLVLPMC
jgi:hypothetical protein